MRYGRYIIWLLCVWVTTALAEPINAPQISGSTSLSVSNVSSNVALPSGSQFPALLLINNGLSDLFYALGGSSVAATTGSISLPAGYQVCVNSNAQTKIAAITSTGTTTLQITQMSSCPVIGRGGSGTGGTPGGANTQVQYNNSGAFGGSPLFTFNSTTGNVTFNNFFATYQSTVSAGATTILTASSGRYQTLTGSSNQTFQLPDATTLASGFLYLFNNNSSGSLIITNNGGVTQYTIPAGGMVQVGPTSIATANGVWDFHPLAPATVTWGSGATGFVMNTALSSTPSVSAGTPSATVPAFIPRRDALTTGVGAQAAGNVNLIAAGVEQVRVNVGGVQFPAYTTPGVIQNDASGNLTAGSVPAAQMPALTGDCTTSAGTVATTCTSINGVNQTTAWNTYTPTITASVGTFSSVTGQGRWRNVGKTCFIMIDIAVTTVGTASGSIVATLPAGACGTAATGSAGYTLTGVDRTTNGKALTGLISSGASTVGRIVYYDNTFPGASGTNNNLTGVYESN